MTEGIYEEVVFTDIRTTSERELKATIAHSDAKERRSLIARFLLHALNPGSTTSAPFEIQWGRTTQAPAQVFVGDSFAGDLEFTVIDPPVPDLND